MSIFKFLHINISDDLSLAQCINEIMKMAYQSLYFLRGSKRFSMWPDNLSNFYRCRVESILPGCNMGWCSNSKHTRMHEAAVNARLSPVHHGNYPPCQWTHLHMALPQETGIYHQESSQSSPCHLLSAIVEQEIQKPKPAPPGQEQLTTISFLNHPTIPILFSHQLLLIPVLLVDAIISWRKDFLLKRCK